MSDEATPTGQPAPAPDTQEQESGATDWHNYATLATAFLTAVLPLIPGAGPVLTAWVAANPAAFSAIVAGAFTLLHTARPKAK